MSCLMATLELLTRQLRSLDTEACPFTELPEPKYRRSAHWVTPTMVATIEIAEFTNSGHVRHASFIQLTS